MAKRRPRGRWDTPPRKLTRRHVRSILVEDIQAGVDTPVGWATDAYCYLGYDIGERVEHEIISVLQETAGHPIPGAPGW